MYASHCHTAFGMKGCCRREVLFEKRGKERKQLSFILRIVHLPEEEGTSLLLICFQVLTSISFNDSISLLSVCLDRNNVAHFMTFSV